MVRIAFQPIRDKESRGLIAPTWILYGRVIDTVAETQLEGGRLEIGDEIEIWFGMESTHRA